MLGIAQWRGLGVNSMLLLADIGGAQHAQPFGVCSHNSVLDSVMHHLHEVAGPARTAVQVALFGSPLRLLDSRRARDATCAGRERREDRIEMVNHIGLAANHHAVASLQSPHTTARANVNVMDTFRREFLCASDIVYVI